MPTATLVRDYGVTQLPGETSWTTRARLDLTGYFVLVKFLTHDSGVMWWMGFIESIDAEAAAVDAANVIHGTQTFRCFGLERAWIG